MCFFFTVLGTGHKFFSYPPITWISIGGLVLFPTLLGHALFTYLLRYFDVNWLSTGKLAEPLLASLTAFLFFHETWTPTIAMAFACTGVSLLILLEPWKHLPYFRGI